MTHFHCCENLNVNIVYSSVNNEFFNNRLVLCSVLHVFVTHFCYGSQEEDDYGERNEK
jgi:hypothetical protein